MQRAGAIAADVRARFNRQMPLDGERKFADFVIDTSGDKEDTLRQTRAVYEALRRIESEKRCDRCDLRPSWWPGFSMSHLLTAGMLAACCAARDACGGSPRRPRRPVFRSTNKKQHRYLQIRPRRHRQRHVHGLPGGLLPAYIPKKEPARVLSSTRRLRILTNYRVVSGNQELSVTLADKKVYKARVLGRPIRATIWR